MHHLRNISHKLINRWCWKLVVSMYNLIEYGWKYSEITGSLWFYIASTNNFKSFMYEAKLLENTEADNAYGILKNAITTVPLKYLSNFWRC